MLACIPKKWKELILKHGIVNNHDSEDDGDDYDEEDLINILDDVCKPTRTVYNMLIKDKCSSPIDRVDKWNEYIENEITEHEWLDAVKNVKLISQSSYIRSFSYKFMFREVPYGSRLYLMKRVDSDLCNNCKECKETLMHLYWDCPHAKRLWECLKVIIKEIWNIDVSDELNVTWALVGVNKAKYGDKNLSNTQQS